MHNGDIVEINKYGDDGSLSFDKAYYSDYEWRVNLKMIDFLKEQALTLQRERFTIRKVNFKKDGRVSSLRIEGAPKYSLWPPEIFTVVKTKHKYKREKLLFK